MSLATAWFWPNVGSRKNALFAIEEAFWIPLALSVFSLVFALVEFLRAQESDFEILGFANGLFFGGIAFGIRRRSRIAATAGFGLFVLSRAFLLPPTGLGSFVIATLIALALLQGVRGTFAYHKLPPLPAGMPSIEQSFQAVADSHGQNESTSQE